MTCGAGGICHQRKGCEKPTPRGGRDGEVRTTESSTGERCVRSDPGTAVPLAWSMAQSLLRGHVSTVLLSSVIMISIS